MISRWVRITRRVSRVGKLGAIIGIVLAVLATIGYVRAVGSKDYSAPVPEMFGRVIGVQRVGAAAPSHEAGQSQFLVNSSARSSVAINYAEGKQTLRMFESGSQSPYTVERDVKVWLADDGRYRVLTSDASGASEDISYDGRGHQRVLITAPGGSQRALLLDGYQHFAVDGVGVEAIKAGGLVVSDYDSGPDGDLTYKVTNAVVRTMSKTSELVVKIPRGVEILDGAGSGLVGAGGSLIPIASSSADKTFFDYSGYPCVYGYNYRNSVSNFFTANSQVRSACSIVDVSAWDNAGLWCGGAWQGSGGASWAYSSWTGYFETTQTACSAHAGWTSSWVIVVSWRPLPAAVSG